MWAPPSTISWSKVFFKSKIGKYEISDFGLFIEQDISDKKYVDFSEFCRFSSKWSYHSHQKRLCKFLFLARTLVKENNNLMCRSL